MIAYHDFFELIENYSVEAAVEYSVFEKTRHNQFVYDDYDGSHKKAIKHWRDVLTKGVAGKLGDAILFEVGEGIVERATDEIKAFYGALEDDDDKRFFLQVLMKTERKILNLDLERFKGHKNAVIEDIFSPFEHIETKKVSVQKVVKTQIDDSVEDIEKQAAMMKIIREKKRIDVKEFELLYGKSSRTQQNLRTRFRNPLPCIQNAGRGGKVYYDISEVDKWFENERK